MGKVGLREEGVKKLSWDKKSKVKDKSCNLEYLESTELNAPGVVKVYLLVL